METVPKEDSIEPLRALNDLTPQENVVAESELRATPSKQKLQAEDVVITPKPSSASKKRSIKTPNSKRASNKRKKPAITKTKPMPKGNFTDNVCQTCGLCRTTWKYCGWLGRPHPSPLSLHKLRRSLLVFKECENFAPKVEVLSKDADAPLVEIPFDPTTEEAEVEACPETGPSDVVTVQ